MSTLFSEKKFTLQQKLSVHDAVQQGQLNVMEKNKNKVIIIAYMQLQFTDVMKKNVGLANTASNCFISQTTYYVYEATNILFTFENRGALKQY